MIKIKTLSSEDRSGLHKFLVNKGAHFYQLVEPFSSVASTDWLVDQVEQYANSGQVFLCEDNNEVIGLIAFKKRDWDTAYFGYPVASVDYLYAKEDKEVINLMIDEFERWASRDSIKLVSVKIFSTEYVADVLRNRGFNFIMEEVVLVKKLPDQSLNNFTDERIRSFEGEDLEGVVDIIKNTKWTERFHRDKHFSKAQADGVYVNWFGNGIKKNNGRAAILDIGGGVGGFILWTFEELRLGDKKFMVADQELVAVKSEIQGKGFGKILYAGALLQMQKAGIDIVKTTVSASNQPALKAQEKMGFKADYRMTVFHKYYN